MVDVGERTYLFLFKNGILAWKFLLRRWLIGGRLFTMVRWALRATESGK